MEPLPYKPKFKCGDKIRCINPGGNDLIKGTIYTFKKYCSQTTIAEIPCIEVFEPTDESGYFEYRFELSKEDNFSKLYLKLKR